jgi:hypothetical protein
VFTVIVAAVNGDGRHAVPRLAFGEDHFLERPAVTA